MTDTWAQADLTYTTLTCDEHGASSQHSPATGDTRCHRCVTDGIDRAYATLLAK